MLLLDVDRGLLLLSDNPFDYHAVTLPALAAFKKYLETG